MNTQFKTIEKEHWENNWKSNISLKPLSLFNIFNFDVTRLLRAKVAHIDKPQIAEIGFAPGKILRHIEYRCNAICHGYDYSENGCNLAKIFLDSQSSKIIIHCQDVLKKPEESTRFLDLVYSIGVVEHFKDPTQMIIAHLQQLNESGVAIIVLPNYTRLNKLIQKHLDPDNLEIHNIELMYCEYWKKMQSSYEKYRIKTYYYGSFSPWMFSLKKIGKLSIVLQLILNFIGFIFPKNLPLCASMFVIEFRKK